MHKYAVTELSEKLGISRQAVYKALRAGRLFKGEGGLIDARDPRNLAFFGNLDRRQRRGSTGEGGKIPERSAARLSKYKARYRLWMSRYQAKINNLIEATLIEAVFEGGRGFIAEELSKLPTRMKRSDILRNAPDWLHDRIGEIFKASRSAVSPAIEHYRQNGQTWVDPAATLPKKPPRGAGVFVIMALLDKLQAARYELQRATEAGILISLKEAREIGEQEISRIKMLIFVPYRYLAIQLQAAVESHGIKAARKVLAAEVQKYIEGLKKKIAQTEAERQAA